MSEEWSAQEGAGQTACCSRLCWWKNSNRSSNRGQGSQKVTEPIFFLLLPAVGELIKLLRVNWGNQTIGHCGVRFWTDILKLDKRGRLRRDHFVVIQLRCEDQVQRTGLSNCQTLTGRREKFHLRKQLHAISTDWGVASRCFFFILVWTKLVCSFKKKRWLQYTAHLQQSFDLCHFRTGNERLLLNKRWHLSLFQIFLNISAAIWNQSWSFVLVIIQSWCLNPSPAL